MNSFFSFLFWLAGVLQMIAMLGGLAFWLLFGWLVFSKKGWTFFALCLKAPEYRCHSCLDRESCGAAFTDVLYPCWWYVEDDLKEKKP